jgi:hypothetical protein
MAAYDILRTAKVQLSHGIDVEKIFCEAMDLGMLLTVLTYLLINHKLIIS